MYKTHKVNITPIFSLVSNLSRVITSPIIILYPWKPSRQQQREKEQDGKYEEEEEIMIYVPNFLPCVLFRTVFFHRPENCKVSWTLFWLTWFVVMQWKRDTLGLLLTVPPVLLVQSEIRSRFPEMWKCSSALKKEAAVFCETLVALHRN